MLGFGALGELALGEGPSRMGAVSKIAKSTDKVALSVFSLVIPDNSLVLTEKKVAEGRLIRSTSVLWFEFARRLASDWSVAQELTSEQWEELVAGAFKKHGYDDVILTPRSGDHGRDIIATRHGIGCVKIFGSVKAYKPGNLVRYDDIRALVGVISTDLTVSKGIITTTSDFPPKAAEDPSIAPLVPTRLELMNGKALQEWLRQLSVESEPAPGEPPADEDF